MNLNHETSQDKKQIKVWIREPVIAEIELPYEDKMIEIKRKNKNKLVIEKEEIQNQQLLRDKLEETKIKNIGGSKFGNGLQGLIGEEESESEDGEGDEEEDKRKKELVRKEIEEEK